MATGNNSGAVALDATMSPAGVRKYATYKLDDVLRAAHKGEWTTRPILADKIEEVAQARAKVEQEQPTAKKGI